jgi:hypothetical protein
MATPLRISIFNSIGLSFVCVYVIWCVFTFDLFFYFYFIYALACVYPVHACMFDIDESSHITSLFVIYRFGMHTYGNFRLGGALIAYPMTFSEGLKL